MKKQIIEHLLEAPDHHLDPVMKPYVEKWSDPPTALQVLEVLDLCISDAMASGFIVTVLQALYDITCKEEKTTHDDVVKLAVWRNKP